MKISCLQDNLSKGLGIVSHSVGRETSLPILSSVLLKTEDNLITLSATNLDIGVHCTIRGKVDADGVIALDARVFTEYVSLLPKEKIDLELTDGVLSVKCGTYTTKIHGINPEDFPLLPSLERVNGITTTPDELKKAIQATSFAVASEDNRAELSGVLFEYDGEKNTLSLVATDAHRLSKKTIPLNGEKRASFQVIVPLKTVQEVQRILSSDTGNQIEIFMNDNQILFCTEGVELLSKIIHGTYPDYNQIIPSSFETETVIEVPEVVKAVKISSIFSKGDDKQGSKDVHLSLRNTKEGYGEISVSAQNTTVGENTTVIQIEMKGGENEVSLNYKYLLEGLQSLEDERLSFSMIDSSNPCIMKPLGRSDAFYLIMPLRE